MLYTLTRTKMPRNLLSVHYSLQTKGAQLYSKHVFVTAISLCNEQNLNLVLWNRQEKNSKIEGNLTTWMLDSNSKVLCRAKYNYVLAPSNRGAQILDANRYTTFGSPSSRQCQTDRRRKHLYNLNKRLTLNCTSLSDSNVLRAAGLGTCVLPARFSVCEPELQDSDNQL